MIGLILSTILNGALVWQCEARVPWPGETFLGQGATKMEAEKSALDSCHASGHAFCFLDGNCETVGK